MSRLNWKQLLFALAVGVLFASLQGDPPVKSLRRLASVTCSFQKAC